MMKRRVIVFVVALVLILLVLLVPGIIADSDNSCCGDYCMFNEGVCDAPNSVCEESSCEIGCCVDRDGAEHNNYPQKKCLASLGSRNFYSGTCTGMYVCR